MDLNSARIVVALLRRDRPMRRCGRSTATLASDERSNYWTMPPPTNDAAEKADGLVVGGVGESRLLY